VRLAAFLGDQIDIFQHHHRRGEGACHLGDDRNETHGPAACQDDGPILHLPGQIHHRQRFARAGQAI
jgi:hypothetical protein